MDQLLWLPRTGLGRLFDALRDAGHRIIGPSAKNGSIRFLPLDSPEALPWGLSDDQGPGHYRLVEGPAERAFFWTTAALALKPLVFPPEQPLWRVERDDRGRLAFFSAAAESSPLAVIGVRACDLAALELQDRHFAADPWYEARRKALFIIAVNCARSSACCFCASTGDGPEVRFGYDLLLDETTEGFVVRAGSAAGRGLLEALALSAADADAIDRAAAQTREAAKAQQRRLPQQDLAGGLAARRAAAVWEEVARRCLACGNCTAVCPTCFCHRHTEAPALDASGSEHGRVWDSCFSEEHSLLHGRPHRATTAQRYRQWLGHKLGAWHAQYGRSGCTGCGRCITWCPAAIDLTGAVGEVMAAEVD